MNSSVSKVSVACWTIRVRLPAVAENLLSVLASMSDSETTQSPMLSVTGACLLLLKRPEQEPDHSPASSAKFKNAWSVTYTSPHIHASTRCLSAGVALHLALNEPCNMLWLLLTLFANRYPLLSLLFRHHLYHSSTGT
jgi:hypothetical protein